MTESTSLREIIEYIAYHNLKKLGGLNESDYQIIIVYAEFFRSDH